MTFISRLVDELERESARTIRVLEQVPPQQAAWKPHDRSMEFGPLVQMVATMPSWVAMIVTMDELDIAPKHGPQHAPPPADTAAQLIEAHAKAMEGARGALASTDEAFLQTPWRLLRGGEVALELPRHEMIRDTINHWAHHRGQLTVYLRLLGARVPSVYGPSADDSRVL